VKSIRTAQIRLPEKYSDLTQVFSDLFTKVFSQFDVRDDGSVFVNSLYYDGETLQVGNAEIGEGTNINEGAKVTTQRVLPTINYANVGSVQSAIPITAFADAVIATVSIDAHDVIYGGETVSYSAGEVIGVPVSTDVYIYADDPDLEGGAVTYEFTTDYTDMAQALGRYKVGAIRTPISSISAAVSAATNANPCAITTGANHGFSSGDVVDFSGVGGMTELNTGTFTITVTSPTSFTLNTTDSTTFGVYTSGGTVTRVSTPADGIGGAGADGGFYNLGFYYP
jgi:hypothetical protein